VTEVLLSFDDALARRLPLPLAQLYRRAHNSKSGLERHHTAYYIWEAALKLLAAGLLVEYAALPTREPAISRSLENLARPALGHWWELVRKLLPLLAASGRDRRGDMGYGALHDLILGASRGDLPRAAGLDAALRDALGQGGGPRPSVRVGELFDRLVHYRNSEFGHGAAGQRPSSFYERMGRALLAGVAALLQKLDVLAGKELIYVAEVRLQAGGGWLVERYELAGETSRRLETLELPPEAAVRLPRPAQVYSQSAGAPASDLEQETLRSLHPLVLFDPETQEFSYRNVRRGERSSEYLCYSSGRLRERRDLAEDLRLLIGSLRGAPAEEAEVRGWAERSRAEEGAAPTAAERQQPQQPRRIGEFEILSRIGRGGMGVVYRAWQPSLERQVALKCLYQAGDPKVEVRFAREIRALGRVEHPHLAKIFTSGSEGDQWYYAMELIEGADLAAVCAQLAAGSASDIGASDWERAVSSACEKARHEEQAFASEAATEGWKEPAEKPRPAAPPQAGAGAGAKLESDYIRRAAEVVRQAAEAAHALHEAGVVHRDIKPANIMLTAGGEHAVLMDLGLAQLIDDAQGRLTRTRQFVGTLRYASPEQLLAAGALDRRSDVYSLGATLWELITLRPLFGAGEETPTPQLMLRIQSEEPARPRRHNPRVPADLEAIALKCLEKSPERRYPTAAELAADLGRFLRGEIVHAQPPTLGYFLAKLVRRYRLRLAAAAGLLLVLLTFAVISTVRVHRANREARLTVFDLHTSAGLEAGRQMNFAQALLWFASAASVDHGDPERTAANEARLENWRGETPLPVRAFLVKGAEGDSIRGLEFHPGGAHLLVLQGAERCSLWDLEKERPLPLPGEDGPVTVAAWSPDGDLLALGRPDGSAELFRFPGGAAVARLEGSPGRLNALAFRRDGRFLALGNDHARLWDLERSGFAGEPIVHPQPLRWLGFGSTGSRLLTAAADDMARLYTLDSAGTASGPLFAPVRHLSGYDIPGLPSSEASWFPVLIDEDRALLTVTTPTEVTWWDAATGAERRRISAAGRLAGIMPSPDGRWAAIVDFLKAQLWHLGRERPEGEPLAPFGQPAVAAWSPDASAFFLAGDDRAVRRWTFPARRPGSEFHQAVEGGALLPHLYRVLAMASSPTGEVLATAQADGLVRLWRLVGEDTARKRDLSPFVPRLRLPVAVSPDGRHALISRGSSQRPMAATRVFEIESGAFAGPLLRTAGSLVEARFSPDGTRVYTLTALEREASPGHGSRGCVELWDWRLGERLWQAFTRARPQRSECSAGGNGLSVRCSDGEVIVFDAFSGSRLSAVGPLDPGAFFAFVPGGEHFITWEEGRPLDIRQVSTGDARRPGLERETTCRSVRFPGGGLLLTESPRHAVEVWDLVSGRLLSPELEHPARLIHAILEGDQLLTSCADQLVRSWSWRSGQLAGPPLDHRHGLAGAGFLGPQGGSVYTASLADGLCVWDASTGKLLAPPQAITDASLFWLGLQPTRAGVIAGGAELHRLPIHWREGGGRLGRTGWQRLAEIASGEAVERGGAVRLESEEWLRRLRAFRADHPERFALVASAEATGWHRARAAALEGEHQWEAAAWHLSRLGPALSREDRRLEARLHRFVRAWRFAPRAFPWSGAAARSLDPLDPAEIEAIAAAAQAAKLIRYRGPYVDFLAQYPEDSTLVRGYCLRTIVNPDEGPRRIRILAGSDDTLRIWLDGRELLAFAQLGAAVADYLETEAELPKGESTLLVEVGQSGGDWGLYLRFEDAEGRALHLRDDGVLEPLEEE
jgi:serine/threonine protein kinase/WD40 repeat protein